jgi:hypothetical protein
MMPGVRLMMRKSTQFCGVNSCWAPAKNPFHRNNVHIYRQISTITPHQLSDKPENVIKYFCFDRSGTKFLRAYSKQEEKFSIEIVWIICLKCGRNDPSWAHTVGLGLAKDVTVETARRCTWRIVCFPRNKFFSRETLMLLLMWIAWHSDSLLEKEKAIVKANDEKVVLNEM